MINKEYIEKKLTMPPVVCEQIDDDGAKWFLSFGGHDPLEDECIELTEKQCFWIKDKIEKMDLNYYVLAAEKQKRLQLFPEK